MFEFNENFLNLLAYHSVSSRFVEFTFDTERSRFETTTAYGTPEEPSELEDFPSALRTTCSETPGGGGANSTLTPSGATITNTFATPSEATLGTGTLGTLGTQGTIGTAVAESQSLSSSEANALANQLVSAYPQFPTFRFYFKYFAKQSPRFHNLQFNKHDPAHYQVPSLSPLSFSPSRISIFLRPNSALEHSSDCGNDAFVQTSAWTVD